jgi:hypothetical protein
VLRIHAKNGRYENSGKMSTIHQEKEETMVIQEKDGNLRTEHSDFPCPELKKITR